MAITHTFRPRDFLWLIKGGGGHWMRERICERHEKMNKLTNAAQAIKDSRRGGEEDEHEHQDPRVEAEEEAEDDVEEEVEESELVKKTRILTEELEKIFTYPPQMSENVFMLAFTIVFGAVLPLKGISKRLKAIEDRLPEVADFTSKSTNGKECRSLAKDFIACFDLFPDKATIEKELRKVSLADTVRSATNMARAVSAVNFNST